MENTQCKNVYINKYETVVDTIKNVLTELAYEPDSIEHIINSNDKLKYLDTSLNIDFKIDIPYENVEDVFGLNCLSETALQEKIICHFNQKGFLKNVDVIYRDDVNKNNPTIMLNADLKFYDFVIRIDDPYEIIKKDANNRIKENIIKLSQMFKTHQSVLMSICEDVLFSDNDYFSLQNSQMNQISNGHVNAFKLMTTAIYTGISLDSTPRKIKTNNPEQCSIYFDNQQNITSFKFQITKTTMNGQIEVIELLFNENAKLIYVDWRHRVNGVIHSKEFNIKGLSLIEIIEILSLKFNMNETINDLIPELTVPSAYNFNSAEFQDRLLVARMILM